MEKKALDSYTVAEVSKLIGKNVDALLIVDSNFG